VRCTTSNMRVQPSLPGPVELGAANAIWLGTD
jgi:hypothetical protein